MGVERSCLEQPLEVDKNFTQISSPVGWFISQITSWLGSVPVGWIMFPQDRYMYLYKKTIACQVNV